MDVCGEEGEVGLGLGFGWVVVGIAFLQKSPTKIMHVAEKWTRKP